MTTPFGFFDLVETLPQAGCALCNLLLRDVDRQLDSILYEFVTEPKMQRTFRASRGLCNEHGARLLETGNALSVAVLYERVIEEALAVIDGAANTSKPRKWLNNTPDGAVLAAALAPNQACVACAAMNENEARYVAIFSEYSADERLHDAYTTSHGLCLKHFRRVLSATRDPQRARQIVEMQKAIWERLRAELNEFMRKYDVNHAAEAMGAEADSWRRALTQVGGARGVFPMRDRARDRTDE